MKKFGISYAGHQSIRMTIEEPPPFALQRKRGLYGFSRCVLLFGTFGGRGMTRCSMVGKGPMRLGP